MELPPGWAAATLGDIRRSAAQRAVPSAHPDKVFELWSVPSFERGVPERLRGAAIGSDKQAVVPGALLVCKINPRINRVWVVGPKGEHEQIASTEWIPFFPVEGVNPSYLRYYLQQDQFREYLATNVSGVGGSLMRVRPAVLDSFPLVLAPQGEQVRIVAVIEEHLTDLEAAAVGLRRVKALALRYRAAVITAACEGKLQVGATLQASSWPFERLGSLIAEGPQNGLYLPRRLYGRGTPILRIDDFQHGWSRSSADMQRVDAELDDVRRFALRPGDLVINRVNSPSHLGKVIVIEERHVPALFESNMMRLRVQARVDPRWIALWLQSASGKASLLKNAKWAVNQASINQQDVAAAGVPLPPLPVQHAILSEVDRRLSLLVDVEQSLSTTRVRADRLRQSILKRAFEGNLVPQDPNDEPAEKVLERIRAHGVPTHALARRRRHARSRR